MERLILAATAAALIASPVTATPYREFVDVKKRATPGETVIRAFPDASQPSFKLILRNGGPSGEPCEIWLEFVSRGRPFDHFGILGRPTQGNRVGLVNGPHFEFRDSLDFDGLFPEGDLPAMRGDAHWVARGTNDALELTHADVALDDDGNCVAGTRARFTPDLAYRDVVDSKQLTDYGEVRIRGFPGDDPTFTLRLEYLPEGTVLEQGGSETTLSGDVCALTLEWAPDADIWVPEGIAISDNFVGNKSFLDAVGPGSNSVEHAGVTLPWYAHATGEIFRVVSANLLHLSEGDAVCEGSPSQRCFSGPVCFGEARVQWAPQAEDFYR